MNLLNQMAFGLFLACLCALTYVVGDNIRKGLDVLGPEGGGDAKEATARFMVAFMIVGCFTFGAVTVLVIQTFLRN